MRAMDHITFPECPSPWTRPQRGKLISVRSFSRGCAYAGHLGRSWTFSHQSNPRPFLRSPLAGDTNPQRPLDFSLVAGSRHRNRPGMRVAHRWMKPLGSLYCRDHLFPLTSPPWRRLLKMYLPRPSLRLRRRRRKTRNGGCARSCESRLGCSLPPLGAFIRLSWILKEGPTHSLSWYIWIYLHNSQYAFAPRAPAHPIFQ